MFNVTSWTANIYVGLKVDKLAMQHRLSVCEEICQQYCNTVGWCVTVTPTKFIYKDGYENGAIVGIIHYPRFPTDTDELERRTKELATLLKEGLQQKRVSIVFPDKTVMLGEKED